MNEEVVKQLVLLARGWASSAGVELDAGWESEQTAMLTKEDMKARALFRCSLEVMQVLHGAGLVKHIFEPVSKD